MKRGILFDLDGTLWDAAKEVAYSFNLAIEDYPEFSRKLTEEDLQSIMGKVMTDAFAILLPEAPIERMQEITEHLYEVENEYLRQNGGTLMPHLVETLEILKKDYSLYIVSNCQDGYIQAFLDHYKLWDYFEDVECWGVTDRPKWENIRMVVERNQVDQGLYVGDTQWDYDAALKSGLPFIHAKTGYGEVDAQVPAITDLIQLPDIVREMFAF